eukprot:7282438-Lingulodinium_polyedra.AAC.1
MSSPQSSKCISMIFERFLTTLTTPVSFSALRRSRSRSLVSVGKRTARSGAAVGCMTDCRGAPN